VASLHVKENSAQPGVEPYPVPPVALVLAAGGLGLTDWAYRRVGSSVSGGALDETAHALTVLLVLWAMGRRSYRPPVVPALVGSVAIDLDHIPRELGTCWLTAGTPRPYTHSLLTIAVLLIAARLWRRRRMAIVGFALGVSVHFMRDLADSSAGVSLLWPWSTRPFTIPRGAYLAGVALLIAITAMRRVSGQPSGQSQPRRACA
jgi:inner membrane protein